MALAGMIIGASFWWLGSGSAGDNTAADREPTATKSARNTFKVAPSYRPSLPTASDSRADEAAGPVTVVEDSVVAQPATELTSVRQEIAKQLVNGDMDQALELAKNRLAERAGSSNEPDFIGYLQEFIFQNSQDQVEDMNVTLAAMRSAQNPHVRRYLYDKFNSFRPQLSEEFNGALVDSGITIQ